MKNLFRVSFIIVLALTSYYSYQIGNKDGLRERDERFYDRLLMAKVESQIAILVRIRHLNSRALDGIDCNVRGALNPSSGGMRIDLNKRVGEYGADEEFARSAIKFVDDFNSNYETSYPTTIGCVESKSGDPDGYLSAIIKMTPKYPRW